jgi:hypothetical protein
MSQSLDADLLDDLGEPEGPGLHAAEDSALGDPLEADFDGAEGMEMEAEDAADELEQAVTEALDADDADEFLGSLWKGIRSVAKKIAPIVSKVAPLLPIPGAGLIGKAADVVSKVAADEADELDAIDGLIDVADDAEALEMAAPVVAGLAIRKAVPNVSRMPHGQRKQLVKATSAAARHIARRHGPEAVAAMPAIVRQARRTAAQQGIPSHELPHLVRRTAAKVSKSPRLLRRFAHASGALRTAQPMGVGGRGTMRRHRIDGGETFGYDDPITRRGRARYGWREGPSRHVYGYRDGGVDRRITLRGPVRITVETV